MFDMMKGDFMGIKNINITLTYANIVGNTILKTISFLDIDKKNHINIKNHNRYIQSLPLVVFINAIQNIKALLPNEKISNNDVLEQNLFRLLLTLCSLDASVFSRSYPTPNCFVFIFIIF